MTGGEIGSFIGIGILGVSLILTAVRNGKTQTKYMASMETRQNEQIKGINGKLDDSNTGLGAIKKSVDEQRVHCAGVVGDFGARIENLEKK
ncbi:unnamed protein product [marine sediment metagenome]|uniref:Uncharacterized protein n=1 Tax=marine sediment metagenome TaxID=412755 RepID=X1GEI6_9ZZZZ